MDLAGLNVTLRGLWMDLPEDSPMRDWTSITDDADDCVDNHEVAALYRRSRTGINFYRREAEDGHEGRGVGVSGPARSRWPPPDCGSPATPGPNPTSCSRCCRRSPARRKPGTSSAGPSPTRTSAPKPAAKARAAVADRTFTEHAKQLLRLLDRQPATM